jgi:uncharacterized oligopeptide transporter (OPT) family protein
MLKQLNEEQIRTMSLEEKDKWWLENVWRGDMPQLTLRSAATGMILGAILSMTNLYVGAKTGWTLGVGITSVILSFALWKVLAKMDLGSEMTILENNAMQSIATAAGYMTAPLISSLTAYMMVTGKVIPLWQSMTWIMVLALLGVLFAFPLKKRFINEEQHPFPEGKACGIVMEGLHSEDPKEGAIKTGLLLKFGGFSAFWMVLQGGFLKLIPVVGGILRVPVWLHKFLNETIFSTKILGTKLSTMTISLETDIVMYAVGGLIGLRTGISLIIGAVVNYFILAPVLIDQGIIVAGAKGTIGFREITIWSLWGGVAMMTTASLWSFLSKPKMILSAFTGMFSKEKSADVLKDIELPMKVFAIGIPLVGLTVVTLAHFYFDVGWMLGAIAIPLVFVFTLIAVNSTALTAITPTGALGKLTQLTFAGLAPGNVTTNLMTAGITGEVAGNASNLLMDIKPGYMLGAKPRHQAMGHVLGIISGGLVATPIFYLMFNNDVTRLMSEKMPMPAAVVWKAVAELLTKGFSALHVTAIYAVVIGAILGILFEVIKTVTKGKFFISGVGMGLAFVIPFSTCLSMFLGALFFWVVGKMAKDQQGWWQRIGLKNQETICAGIIAGGAIMGIAVIIIDTLLGT